LWACVSEVTLSYFFVRMQILSHSRNTHTVYNAYTYTHTVTRAYCKLQKLLPLAKLISKYASWHLMPSVTEIRAKDPAGGLKFVTCTLTTNIQRAPRLKFFGSPKA
jgi:hypothetical protein